MDPEAEIRPILESEKFAAAAARLAKDHDRLISEIIRLTAIPAPPFQEAERARTFGAMVREDGLQEARIDPEGNVTALRRGEGQGLLCVAAHLDTVFPPGTDVRVRREGTRLYAPGIGDDTRSLAVLLAWMRALDAAEIRTKADVLFVADVGEEGPGDLRGMRYLFQKGEYAGRITAFITVDSPDMERVVTTGVGSKRYRVTFRAPGGHSYGAFGRCHRPALPARGSFGTAHHLLRQFDRRGHVDQLDPERSLDGVRPAFGIGFGAWAAGSGVHRGYCGGCRRRKFRPFGTRRARDRGSGKGWRPAGRADGERGRTVPACLRRAEGTRLRSPLRSLLDRCEPADEPGNSRDKDRLRRDRWPGALTGRMD
jgi:hypothetical protein